MKSGLTPLWKMCFISVIGKHQRKLEEIPHDLYLGNYYRLNGPLFSTSSIFIHVFQPHFLDFRYPGTTYIALDVCI